MNTTFFKRYIVVIMGFLPTLLIGQTPVVDSLEAVLKKEMTKTEKIKVYLALSEALLFHSEHEKGREYVRKALKLANKIQNKDLIFEANLNDTKFEFIHGNLDTALYKAKRGLRNLDKNATDEQRFKANKMLAYIYYQNGNAVKAIEFYKKSLPLIAEDNLFQKADLLKNLALCHIYIQDFEQSYAYLFDALKIFKSLENTTEIANCYNILGTQYWHQENWAKAELYYAKSFELIKAENDTLNIIRAGQNLGLIYLQSGNNRAALKIYENNIELATRYKHRNSVLDNQILAARCYADLGETEKAVTIFESIENAADILNFESKMTYYEAASNVYFKAKKYEKALQFAQKLYENSREYQDQLSMKNALEHLSKIYEKTGNFERAYAAHVELKMVSDTLLQRENVEQLTTQKLQSEFQEKQRLSKQENALLNQQIKQQRLIRLILILFAILAIFTAFFVFRYYKKQNQSLEKDLKNKAIIEKQADELQVLYDNQNRFFTNIAHELRTPMTLIAGPISDMLHQNFDAVQQQKLQIVNRNVNYLKGLVNQILDLSKIDKQQLSLQISNFKLTDLITALKNDFSALAEFQQIDFQTPMTINETTELTTDGEKLYIILKNLLANAFKFTNKKTGKISFNCLDFGDTVQISIEDNGSGIAKKDLPNIFKRYFQSTNSTVAVQSGTGIGLAICKEYIELLQGEIRVNSELNKGSLFVITLPKVLKNLPVSTEINLSFLKEKTLFSESKSKNSLPRNLGENSLPRNLRESESGLGKPFILIVEDNLDVCEYLQTILQANYQILFAHNGVEAIEKLENQVPDLIITDVMMPVMNGFELVKQLKQSEKWRKIPVIVLTALNEMKDKLTALRIGIDDYLVKPFNSELLQLRIEYLLNNQKNRVEFEVEYFESENESENSLPRNLGESKSENSLDISFEANAMSDEDAIWLKEVEDLVTANLQDVNYNVYQLCLDLATSKSQLYRRIKLLTGLTPKQYIDQIRYHQARFLLEQNSNTSVKRIAYQVGFKDEKNFARNFKKYYGKYPSDW